MKYCLNYANSSKLMAEADEIKIRYDGEVKELLAFLEKYGEHSEVILEVMNLAKWQEREDWKLLDALNEKYPQYRIKVCFPAGAEEAVIGNLSLPYFYGKAVTTWDELIYYVKSGVCDVYIAEDLGFEVSAVAKYCHDNNVTVRAYPNIAQASVGGAHPLKKFFIRPDDVDCYEGLIDVLEFWCAPHQTDVYFKVYRNQKWLGELREIIKDFDCDIHNSHIVPGFAQARIDCGKRCLRGKPCHICDRIYSISKKLQDRNLMVKKK